MINNFSKNKQDRNILALILISGLLLMLSISLFIIPSMRLLDLAVEKSNTQFEIIESFAAKDPEDIKYFSKLEQANTSIYEIIKTKGKSKDEAIESIEADIDLITNNAEFSEMKEELLTNTTKVSANLENVKVVVDQRSYRNKIILMTALIALILVFFSLKYWIKQNPIKD